MRARATTRLGLAMLFHQPARLALSAAGVAFAALLMLVQIGFRDALSEGSARPVRHLDADLILQERTRSSIMDQKPIERRLVAIARGVPGVADAAPLYSDYRPWTSLADGASRTLRVYAVDPFRFSFDFPAVRELAAELRKRDAALVDRHMHPHHGVARLGPAVLGRRHVDVVGLFDLGIAVNFDGTVITSVETYSRLRNLPERIDAPPFDPDRILLGLVKLAPGAELTEVRARLAALLPEEVVVLTKQQAVDAEAAHLERTAPLTVLLSLGALLGFFVGAGICYQILYTDIMDHRVELATLRAMGYGLLDLYWLVALEALVLALVGYLPAYLAAHVAYGVLEESTLYRFALTADRALLALGVTLLMCQVSGLLAARSVAGLDPAEVF
ncbi:MAG: FtsX-like permease family protein [Planctomycetota bacterium]